MMEHPGEERGEAVLRVPFEGPRIEDVRARVFEVPTEEPESDGTLRWNRTTVVAVEVRAGGERGLGVTYADAAAGVVVHRLLRDAIAGADALDPGGASRRMLDALRNQGAVGIGAMAVSAVDIALWDLKARLLRVSLARLLGRARGGVPLYGSGGFTSYSTDRLTEQLGGWAAEGFGAVKMKVGREPAADLDRVRAARASVGDDVELFVDANGAWTRAEAIAFARRFAGEGVTWLEEPVPSHDRDGLAAIRRRAPAGMRVAAGEYGWGLLDFRRLLEVEAVDVLQVDVTRCGGVTGVLRAAAVAAAFAVPLSTHCAPSFHAALGESLPEVLHLEWFHDHARIESLLFRGAPRPERGWLTTDPSRPGHGLSLDEDVASSMEI